MGLFGEEACYVELLVDKEHLSPSYNGGNLISLLTDQLFTDKTKT